MVYVLLKSIIFSAATSDLCVNIFVGLNSGRRTSDSLHFVSLDPGTFATPYQHLIPETVAGIGYRIDDFHFGSLVKQECLLGLTARFAWRCGQSGGWHKHYRLTVGIDTVGGGK